MNKRTKPTMQDVASLVGVSKQTVSAVINGKPGITPDTTDRVVKAIEQLGYEPDWSARNLRTGRSRTIALLATDVSSPMAGRIASEAVNYAYTQQYNVVLYNTQFDAQRELAYIKSAQQRAVDGVLIMSATENGAALPALMDARVPAVALFRTPLAYPGPEVAPDNVKAGYLAGSHLLDLGHSRIVHIAGPMTGHSAEERLRGFCAALGEQGPLCPLRTSEAPDWRMEAGAQAIRRLLAEGCAFTAAYVAGDSLALGAIYALVEAGLRVPEDVSVIGTDGIELGAYMNPTLSTVDLSIGRIATLGVQMLLALIEGRELEQPHVLIEPALVARKSTAPPGQR